MLLLKKEWYQWIRTRVSKIKKLTRDQQLEYENEFLRSELIFIKSQELRIYIYIFTKCSDKHEAKNSSESS